MMKNKKKHKWKYRINVKKKVLVLVVLGVFLFVGLGYAILGTALGISGLLEIKKFENDKTLYGVIKKEALTNGDALTYSGEHNDSIDSSLTNDAIYYYNDDGSGESSPVLEKNNVVFAGMCWQMFRTTDTGGVKMIYNGEAIENDDGNGTITYTCNHQSSDKHLGINGSRSNIAISGTKLFGTGYTYDLSTKQFTLETDGRVTSAFNSSTAKSLIGYYTCNSTSDTCTTLYHINGFVNSTYSFNAVTDAYTIANTSYNQIGTSSFNNDTGNIASQGYKFGGSYVPYTDSTTLRRADKIINTAFYFSNTEKSINTTYYYSDTVSYVGGSYVLDNPQQVTSGFDYSTLVGKYIMKDVTTYSSVSYVTAQDYDSWLYLKELSGGDLDVNIVVGTGYTDNLDGTYTITGTSDPLEIKDWYLDKNKRVKDVYTCGNSSVTCTDPRYISSYTGTYYSGPYVNIKWTIAKERNGLQLVDYTTIDYSEWVKGYNTTYKDYYYTCDNEDTVCTKENLRYIKSRNSEGCKYHLNRVLANSVSWDGTKYTLIDTIELEDHGTANKVANHHFVCPGIGETECTKVGYINVYNSAWDGYYVVDLEDGVTTAQQVVNTAYKSNQYDSNIKGEVENWYKKNLLAYDEHIDDAIYCNDRSYTDTSFTNSVWNSNGGISDRLDFRANRNTLQCTNVTDQFSVGNNQAKLNYKVGFITSYEALLLGNQRTRVSPQDYWTMSPQYFDGGGNSLAENVRSTGVINDEYTYRPIGVRPVITLIKGTTYISGTGSTTDPYIVGSEVSYNNWEDTVLADTRITATSGTTTIGNLGKTTNGNQLTTLEYYTTCSSGTATGSKNNPQTATITNNAATITINACSNAVLHYRVKDTADIYSFDWNEVNNIGAYMLYGSVYNHLTYYGGTASNDERNLTYWVNTQDFTNTAHNLIAIAYYDPDAHTTVEALDTTTIVERAYPSFFGRDPDNTKATWIAAINNNEETIESFFLEFINSSEAKGIRGAWGLDTNEYHP